MSPPVFRALSTIGELQRAMECLFQHGHQRPALILIFSIVDICSSLALDERSNGLRFQKLLQLAMMPKSKHWDVKPEDLWSARCSVLHSYRADGERTEKDGLRPVYFYVNGEDEAHLRREISKRKKREFLLIDMETMKWIAIDAVNFVHMHSDAGDEYADVMEANAPTVLSDLAGYQVENFIQWADEVKGDTHDRKK